MLIAPLITGLQRHKTISCRRRKPRKGYQVVNMSFGGDLRLGGQQVSISFQVQNLLNNKYYNHTSYYRLLNVPEPGTNFIINVTVPFGGSVNNHKGTQRNSQRNTKDYSGNQ
jgi:hypothetical protein